MKNIVLLLALAIMAIVLACSTATKAQDRSCLIGKWELQKIGNAAITENNTGREVPTLGLNLTESRVSGFAGCNRYFGNISIDEKTIAFSALGSTKMACLGPNVENQYLHALSKEKLAYRISNGQLLLGEGSGLLVFKKTE